MMDTSDYTSREPTLGIEQWRAAFSSLCYQCDLQSEQPEVFSGWVRPRSIFGFLAADLGCNSGRIGRTQRHVRADSIDHYCAVISTAGSSNLFQNDQAVTLGVGDIALVDHAQPVTFDVCGNGQAEWLAVRLPRRTLISHLGFEPQAGLRVPAGTLAGRALVQLVRDASQGENASPAQSESYLQLTVYDLLGALFANDGSPTVSAHTHKLFNRVCKIIRNSFADPDIGPSAVAAEAGISLRYLQKLFTARGLTCTHFIQSLRLDHALRLVRRRNHMNTRQPLSQIAYICGFSDYTYFARAFRQRFGCPPGGVESAT